LPVTLAFRGLKQEDGEFKANLGYLARPCFQKTRKRKEGREGGKKRRKKEGRKEYLITIFQSQIFLKKNR
jgi:hypothetical protein